MHQYNISNQLPLTETVTMKGQCYPHFLLLIYKNDLTYKLKHIIHLQFVIIIDMLCILKNTELQLCSFPFSTL